MLGSLKQRGGTIVVAAVVGAVAAGSPAVAAEVVAFAKSAGNATTVNKIGASKTPRAGMLVPLNAKGQFPASVIPASRQAGPAGPQGSQGPQGPAGANGAAGAQGPKGNTGATGANGTDGTNGTNGTNGTPGVDAVYPAIVDVNPVPQASASNNWDAFIVNGTSLNNGYRSSHTNGDATSYVEWRLPLEAGNWALEVTYVKADDAGIMTFSLDAPANVLGSIDAYGAAVEQNVRANVPTFAVATSGLHTLRVRTDAKNAASSNYFGYLVWLRLVKQ